MLWLRLTDASDGEFVIVNARKITSIKTGKDRTCVDLGPDSAVWVRETWQQIIKLTQASAGALRAHEVSGESSGGGDDKG